MNHRSTMVRQVNGYLQQRRSLGFGLESQGYYLLKFAKYLDHSAHRGPLTTEVMLRWVNLPKTISRNYRAKRLSAVAVSPGILQCETAVARCQADISWRDLFH